VISSEWFQARPLNYFAKSGWPAGWAGQRALSANAGRCPYHGGNSNVTTRRISNDGRIIIAPPKHVEFKAIP